MAFPNKSTFLLFSAVEEAKNTLVGFIKDTFTAAIHTVELMKMQPSQLHDTRDSGLYIFGKRFQIFATKIAKFFNPKDSKEFEALIKVFEDEISEVKKQEKKLKSDPHEIEDKIKPLKDAVIENLNNLVNFIVIDLLKTETHIKDICDYLEIPKIFVAHNGLYIDKFDPNNDLLTKLNNRKSPLNQEFKSTTPNKNGNVFITNNIINPIDSQSFRTKLGHFGNNDVIKLHNSTNIKFSGKI